uniref:uncharacterized protein LOC120347590 n=1 Tax=Styela clava TaxID=7725 RepID=UPI00193A85C0|nr:uncharacterized protein LOC120347590 [Styela clava]XP_039273564.1 uncharacterized protein LOC120347590 [Styela clava]XP_039273565.1 uncharacterized protein LOC120347590 [Styela clava]
MPMPTGIQRIDVCQPIAGFDAKCSFPEVSGDTCDEFETTPTCTKADDCEDDEVCCSTGCGTDCVKLSNKKPPRKISKFALTALLLSLTNRPNQTVLRAPFVQVPPAVPAVNLLQHLQVQHVVTEKL